MRVERISAQAFRGYPGRVDVVLSGDVVLLYGENGTGKTSLTEAFEWALFGTVVRKARSKTPGEYHGSNWIKNAHADPDLTTFAEVELLTDAGERHMIRREFEGHTGRLLIDGKPADDVTQLNLETEDAFRPFLGQCEIQGLIDSEQQDRWEQLSAILGFGDFGEVRRRLQRLRTDADHDERVKRTREIVNRAVHPLAPEGTDPLEMAPESLRNRAMNYLDLPSTAEWQEIRNAATERLEELYKRDRRPRGLERLMVGPEELRSVVGDLKTATTALVGQVDEHRRWHVENRRSTFAEQGLELIDAERPTRCPFCTEETLTPARVEALEEVSAKSLPKPPDHRRDFEVAQRALQAGGPLGLDVVAQILESLGNDEIERARLEKIAEEQRDLDALVEKFAGLAEGLLAATEQASKPRFTAGLATDWPGLYRQQALRCDGKRAGAVEWAGAVDGVITTIAVNHLVLQVFAHLTDTTVEYQHGSDIAASVRRIWPYPTSFTWPPGPMLTEAGVDLPCPYSEVNIWVPLQHPSPQLLHHRPAAERLHGANAGFKLSQRIGSDPLRQTDCISDRLEFLGALWICVQIAVDASCVLTEVVQWFLHPRKSRYL